MRERGQLGTSDMLWIDSHCHLQDRYRPGDVTVLEAAAQASVAEVGGLVCVGTDPRNSEEAISLALSLRSAPGTDGRPFGAWATVGLHPHDAANGTEGIEDVLERSVGSHSQVVVAVGECGLDYHYDNSPRDLQRRAFATQIGLAHQYGLALVVHSRSAWEDTIDILRAERAPERTVFHCFTGGPAEARRCLDLGASLSFSGIITFKNASEVRDALEMCPLERLLVETDAPFLAPVPHRGEQNRPAWVSVVGEAVARIKSLPVEVVASATVSATRAAFSLS
ncbi:MAG: TatD family hydrolase [Acidimicrobiales bacterium]